MRVVLPAHLRTLAKVSGEVTVEPVGAVERQIALEVRLPPPVAVDVVHVAIERLEKELRAIEKRVERLLIAGKIRSHEFLERGIGAVFSTPELRDLVDPADDSGPLPFTVLDGEILFQFGLLCH